VCVRVLVLVRMRACVHTHTHTHTHTQDNCMTAAEQWSCTNITVVKCQLCMHDGHTLQSLAAEYQTDYLALYSMNVGIPNPDRCVYAVCKHKNIYI
jgi:hypothetical protein